MGVQVFEGLGTRPYLEEQLAFQPGHYPHSKPHARERRAQLLGGARSVRSQVRKEAHEHADDAHNVLLGARVDTCALGVSGAAGAHSAAKERALKADIFAGGNDGRARIKKRTLRRALRRAAASGTARYRGQLLCGESLLDFSCKPTTTSREAQANGPRIGILSWNCGGLSQLLFEEVKVYLKQHREIHILILQETQRSFEREWQEAGWTFISCPADRPKSGGLLLGFRSDFCECSSLRWQVLIPGRLVQARCFAQGQQLDVVAIYQHALPFGDAELKAVLKKRQALWSKLDGYLKALPIRSSVIVAGDFNSGLDSLSPFSGCGVMPHRSSPLIAEERKRLTAALSQHQLCALNTWSRRRETYFHPAGKSQIDFILVRGALADAEARRCHPRVAPLAGWRSSGHLMLQAALPLHWRPWRRAQSQGRSRSGALCTQNSDLLHIKQLVQASGNAVAVFSKPGVRGLDGEIVQFWEARKQLASQRVRTMRDAFQCLRLLSQLRQRHRELRSLARQRKREQLLHILSMAEEAVSRGDSRSLFQCVRWLAPRRTGQKIRLRDKDGNVMHPKAECRMLADYAGELFRARRDVDFVVPCLKPLPAELFSPDAWACALRKLRSGKAVPNGEPSVQAWKDAAETAAVQLSMVSRQALCSEDPHVPDDWTRVQLAWLAKAGKTPNSPEHLRSIGLMPADAKAFLLILRDAAARPILNCPVVHSPVCLSGGVLDFGCAAASVFTLP